MRVWAFGERSQGAEAAAREQRQQPLRLRQSGLVERGGAVFVCVFETSSQGIWILMGNHLEWASRSPSVWMIWAGSTKILSMLGSWLWLLRTYDGDDSCQKLSSPYPKGQKVFSPRWGMTYGPLCLLLFPLNKSERDIAIVWEKIKVVLPAAEGAEVWPGLRASGFCPTSGPLLFVTFALLSV